MREGRGRILDTRHRRQETGGAHKKFYAMAFFFSDSSDDSTTALNSILFLTSSAFHLWLSSSLNNKRKESRKRGRSSEKTNSCFDRKKLSLIRGRLSPPQARQLGENNEDSMLVEDFRVSSNRFDHHFDVDHDGLFTERYIDIRNSYVGGKNSSTHGREGPNFAGFKSGGRLRRRSRLSYINLHELNHDALDKHFESNQAEEDCKFDFLPNKEDNTNVEECLSFKSSIMPNRLVMVRHGQSEGNINEAMYTSCPDNCIKLTKLGWEQARVAGKTLRKRILSQGSDSSVHFIVSPYVRTMETFHGMASAWCDPKEFNHISDKDLQLQLWYKKLHQMDLTFNEDPRIREQDFGNYQDKAAIQNSKKERYKFGIFYYRFPNGESGSDVFDRISTFLDSLWRSFSNHRAQNYVLVTHGISIRVLLARYFRYSIDQFNMMVSAIQDFLPTFYSGKINSNRPNLNIRQIHQIVK